MEKIKGLSIKILTLAIIIFTVFTTVNYSMSKITISLPGEVKEFKVGEKDDPVTSLDVSFYKTASWEEIEKGIAKIELTNVGNTVSEPMDVMLIVDESKSMVFTTSSALASVCSPCMNPSHLNSDGTHNGTVGGTGCQDKLYVTKQTLTSFTNGFMGANPDNRVSLVTFNNKGTVRTDFTNDLNAVQSAITNITIDGSTINMSAPFGETYYDVGFSTALTTLNARSTDTINRKTAVIFLTDGDPTSGHSDCSTSITAMTNSGMEIYTIGLGINETENTTACNYLKSYCTDETTNYAVTETSEGLDTIYENIQNDIFFAGENATITDVIDENWRYYTDSVYKPSPSEPTVNGQTVNWVQDKIDTEYTYTFYIQLKDNAAAEYQDGTWDTNDSAVLVYTDVNGANQVINLENPNLTRKAVTVKYLDKNTNKELKTSEIIKYKEIGDSVSITAPSITGYNLVSSNTQNLIVINGINEIIFYYTPVTGLSYRVEHYVDGVLDSSLTDVYTNQDFGTVINTYSKKNKGYKVVKEENFPLTIGLDIASNVIKVYYEYDSTQTKNAWYAVSYFKDGEIVMETPLTQYQNIHVTEEFLDVVKDTVNVTNKFVGYKFEKIMVDGEYILNGVEGSGDELQEIPDKVSSSGVIHVYYVIDDAQTKDINYKVEYYKDGVYEETVNKKASTQVLKTYATYDKTDVLEENRYTGYSLVTTESELPGVVTEGAVLKVYYKVNSYGYSIEHYYNGVIDNSCTEKKVGIYNDVIKTIDRKDKDGYIYVDTIPLPFTISENEKNNVIRVYYDIDPTQTKDLYYTVEYYKDGQKVDGFTNETTVQVLESNTLTVDKSSIDLNKYEGYEIVEAVVPDTINSGETIKIYYTKRTDLEYTVKYLEEGTNIKLAPEKVVTNQTFETEVTENAIDIDGYNKVKQSEKITIGLENNVITFYYTKRNDLSYKVEHYYNGVLDNSATVMVNNQVFGDIINNVSYNNKDGYKYEKDNLPITITTGENIVKVDYVIDDTQTKEISYQIEYYKNNVRQDDDTETIKQNVHILQGDTLTVDKNKINTTDKYEGYKFTKTEPANIPDTVSNGDVIKVYYTANTYKYRIEYYYGGVIDDTLTENKIGIYGDEIRSTTMKPKYGYIYVGSDPELPVKITNNENANVIKVYYDIDESLTKERYYTVEYYKDNELQTADTIKEIEIVQVLQPDVLTVNKTKINTVDKYKGYKCVSAEIPDTINSGETIKVYYERRNDLEYTVRYLEEGTEKVLAEEKTHKNQVYFDIVSEHAIDINGYVPLMTDQSITIDLTGNLITFLYTKRTDLSYKVEYYYNDVKDEAATVTVENQKFEAEITAYEKKEKTGYKFKNDNLPVIIGTGENIVKVYYVTDEAQTKDISYTVEFYKEGVLDSEFVKTETVQVLEADRLKVNKEELNLDNKYYGYKISEKTVIPEEVNNGEIIKIYYIIDESLTKELSYTVEYYKDGEKVDSDTQTETVTVQVLHSDELTVDKSKINSIDKYYGYRLSEDTVIPDKVESGSVIKVKYVIDETQTKELSYIVEYYKDGNLAEYDIERTTVQVLEPDELTVDKTRINIKDKYLGYKYVENTIPNKVHNKEIIRIDYVFDETQTKDIFYTVEYYKGKELQSDDTQTEVKTVHVLEEDKLTVDKAKINTTDKYYGYKLSDETVIPDVIDSEGIIKVYYEIDNLLKKELSYTVEYYIEGIKQDADTLTESISVQVLQPDIIAVDKTKINIVDKYFGYKTEGIVIPNTVKSETIIRIDYILDEKQTKDLSYTVNYYKDGELAEYETEQTTVQVLQPDSMKVNKEKINLTDKFEGYELLEANIPEVINNGEVINVYYTKRTDLEYIVKYLEQDTEKVLAKEKVVVDQKFEDIVVEYAIDIDGYNKVNLEETIQIQVTGNEIIFYYIKRKDLSYRVEYYYNEVLDEAETIIVENQTFEDIIEDYEKKEKTGYKFDRHENAPLIIGTGENIIKVYYSIDEKQIKTLSFTVEYYIGERLAENETIKDVVQVLQPDTLTVNKEDILINDRYRGHSLVTTLEEVPEIIGNGEVLKIYYEPNTYSYRINYYYDGVIDESKTEFLEAKYGEYIETYPDKNIDGYRFVNTGPAPLVIDIDEGQNIFEVFYVKDSFEYRIEYYYENVRDEEATIVGTATFEDVIEGYKLKDKYGYRLAIKENIPLKITSNPENNIIKIYYVIDEAQTKALSYTVEYYKEGEKQEEDTITRTDIVQVLQPDTLVVDKSKINIIDKYFGYKTENIIIPDVVKTETVIRIDYVIDEAQTKELSYTVEYYKDGVLADTVIENTVVQVLQPDTMDVNKENINLTDRYEGYVLESTEPEIIPDIVETNGIIKVNYIKRTDLEYTVKYLEKDTEKVLAEEKVVVDQTFEDTVVEYAIDIDGYNKVNLEETIQIQVTGNEIIFYYTKRTDLSYRVEYYYNEVLDEAETIIVENQRFEEEITSYTDKAKPGYKLERDTLSLIITTGENVIKVYYVTDEAQTKELSYTVEYYKGVRLADTYVEKEVVQLLESDEMTVKKENINLIDKYFGYKLSEETVIPDIVNSGDVIKVYYLVDETQTKELNYTVEFYKDGIKQENDTIYETIEVQVLNADLIAVRKRDINTRDKYLGYKTENITIPDVVESGTIIRIDYILDETQTKELSYTVEYYKDGIIEETVEEKEIVHILAADEIIVKKENINITDKYLGYKVSENTVIPDKVENGTVIKVEYVIDETQTKELSYTVEYYKDGIIEETVKEKDIVHVLASDEMTVKKENINLTDKYLGYKLAENVVIPDTVVSGEIIKVEYVLDEAQIKELSYTVEYYKDGIIEETVKENKIVHILDSDEMTVDKTKINVLDKYLGYKVIEGLVIPDTVVSGAKIRVDYVLDENQTKELSYTVEYYKSNVLIEKEIETVTVHILKADTIKVDKTKINVIDKYLGYKVVNTIIPNEVANGTVIKVEYVLDETQTKELSYTVEYYKDGALEDTEKVKEIVHILAPDVLTVDKSNMIDKYLGYKISDDTVLPNTVENGTIIKVEYIIDDTLTKELSYTVEYYKDGVIEETVEEKETVHILASDEITVDKTKINITDRYAGYVFEKTEPEIIPDTLENGSVIKVYYEKEVIPTKELSYTVAYYRDGILEDAESVKQVVPVTESDEMVVDKTKINLTNKYLGYKVVENLVIPDKVMSGEIIKVEYVLDETQTKELLYTVEYYKDGALEETVEEKETVHILINEMIVDKTKINITDKYIGYVFEKTEPAIIPDTVENGSIIKVYYEKEVIPTKELSYTVEYYKDGVLADTEIESKVVEITESDEMTVDKTRINLTDKYLGYKLADNVVIPDTIMSGEKIRVDYILDITQTKELSYTVEFYKDGIEIVDDKIVRTEVVQVLSPNTILVDLDGIDLNSKYVGYKLEKSEPEVIPNVVESGTVIKVYYVSIPKIVIKYENEITKEAIIDEIVIEGDYNETYDLTEYVKELDGYTLIIMPELTGEFTNVRKEITFGYARNTNIVIKYLEKGTDLELLPEEIINGYEGKEYVSEAKEVEDYICVESENHYGNMTIEPIVVKHYYLEKAKVIINHIDKDTEESLLVEEFNGRVGDIVTFTSKDFNGYILDTKPENETITLTKEDIVLNYYYKNVASGVIEKHIDIMTNEVLETISHEGKIGDSYKTEVKEYELYDVVLNEKYYRINLDKLFTDKEIDELIKEYNVKTKEELFEKHEDELLAKFIKDNEIIGKEEYLPANAEGTMQNEVIEVKYYYHKKAIVKVEYINDETKENFKETNELGKEEIIIDVINGHVGDEYETNPREFTGYRVIKEKLPVNAKGEMEEETNVKYYYSKIKKKTVEEHVDITKDDVLHEDTHIGDEHKDTTEKEFDGYKPATNKIYYEIQVEAKPEILEENNVKTLDELLVKLELKPDDVYKNLVEKDEDTLVVKYYYVREANVKVQYLDKNTGKEIKVIVDNKEIDTTENIVGYEGKKYTTVEKTFENYSIVKEMYPTNAEGKMAVAFDDEGNINNQILVKYYYVEKSNGVIERHIDIDTNKVIKEIKHEGNVGDKYVTKGETIEGYDIIKEKEPANKEGTMTKEQIIVEYYYKKQEEKVPENPEKPVNPEDPVKPVEPEKPVEQQKPTEPEADKVIIADTTKPNNVITNNNSNNSNLIPTTDEEVKVTPATGDSAFIIVGIIIIVVIVVNLVYILKKKNKKEDNKQEKVDDNK